MRDNYAEVIATRDVRLAVGGNEVLGVLELAEVEARRRGHDAIYLYTHEKMTENQALYSKIGYAEYDRRLDDGLARVFMRKRLA